MRQSFPPNFSSDPDKAWTKLKKQKHKVKMSLANPRVPKKTGFVRFVIISDTHGRHQKIDVADGDVLLHCGDFSYFGSDCCHLFDEFMGGLSHPVKILIAGNHDHRMVKTGTKVFNFRNCVYLQDQATTAFGFKIYGTPWLPHYHVGAFMLDRGDQLRDKWAAIPDETDVLVTHTPPVGYGDKANNGNRAGDVDLLLTVQNRVHPLLHAFGHIHEGRGQWTDGSTVFVNGCSCDDRYRPIAQSIVVDLPNVSRHDLLTTVI